MTVGSQDITQNDEKEEMVDEGSGLKNVMAYQAINDVSCIVNKVSKIRRCYLEQIFFLADELCRSSLSAKITLY